MDSNPVRSRSAIVWLLALACACAAIWWIERQTGRELIAPEQPAPAPPPLASAEPAPPQLVPSAQIPVPPPGRALTPQELDWARTAWNYFDRNLDVQTGLVHSTDGFPATTMWDTGSYLLALIAAQDLGLIEKATFDIRVAKALVALEQLPLYDGKLPNKSYDTGTLSMTDARNQPSTQGVGWSAVDIARLLVPLNLLAWQHPVHTQAARRVLARWDLPALVRGGELMALHAGGDGRLQLTQDGRLGYEQYAARALALLGVAAPRAADWRAHLQLVPVEGVQVCADDRDPRLHGAPNAVESEPYLLAGLEFGWQADARECAWRVYRAQEQRFHKTGVLTAVTEDNVDQPPFFVYNSVWSAGRPWATVTQSGQDASRLRTLSVKAAFGWYALLRTPYTTRLVEKVAPLHEPPKGWFAGRYERNGLPNRALTANTNAVVLESLDFIAHGRMLQFRP
jgi:hypothetical protein